MPPDGGYVEAYGAAEGRVAHTPARQPGHELRVGEPGRHRGPGIPGVRRAREVQPDLILLDIMMPGMDGVEVSRRLRADPTTAPIPIVDMSAHRRLQATAGVMAANDRLPKPFNLDDLYATVERWLSP